MTFIPLIRSIWLQPQPNLLKLTPLVCLVLADSVRAGIKLNWSDVWPGMNLVEITGIPGEGAVVKMARLIWMKSRASYAKN